MKTTEFIGAAERQLYELASRMVAYNAGDPKRIQHLIKVHYFARMIGLAEHVDEATQLILEAAAIVHDIGIRICEQKYGVCDGKHQELEGPVIARTMLEPLGFEDSVIDRVCYLVAHHHTYQDINGLDYQILVEADFLVNLYEDNASREAAEHALQRIFRTESGKSICRDMFGLTEGTADQAGTISIQ